MRSSSGAGPSSPACTAPGLHGGGWGGLRVNLCDATELLPTRPLLGLETHPDAALPLATEAPAAARALLGCAARLDERGVVSSPLLPPPPRIRAVSR